MGIQGVLSTPFYPETNGTAECVNGSLVNILRKLAFNNQANWSTLIPSVLLAYNISLHSTTRFSPFELLYGRKPALPPLLYDILGNEPQVIPEKYFSKLVDTIIDLQSKAFSNSYKAKVKSIDYSKRRRPLPKFSVGDLVLYHSSLGSYRLSKLSTLWKGPFLIIEKTSTDAYTIKYLLLELLSIECMQNF